MAVKGDETARKQFRDRLASGQAREHIATPMFQNEYPLKRSTPRQSKSGLAMPWRSIHEDLIRILAHDDAIVAQNLYILMRCPQPRRRALARTRMSYK